MIDLSQLNLDTSTHQPTDRFDHIRDALRADAPEWEVHQAFAAEYTAKLSTYVSRTHLVKSWFGNTSALREIADANPEIYLDIVNYYAAALDRCTTPSVGNSH